MSGMSRHVAASRRYGLTSAVFIYHYPFSYSGTLGRFRAVMSFPKASTSVERALPLYIFKSKKIMGDDYDETSTTSDSFTI
jgi:hypothetical protein